MNGVRSLNKLLSAFIYVSSHYEIVNHVQGILLAINNLGVNGLIDRLFYILQQFDNNVVPQYYAPVLKVFTKIINISNFINELHSFSKANELGYTKNLDSEIPNLKDYVDNIIQKILLKINTLNTSDAVLYNISFSLCLLIARRNVNFFNVIMTQTNFLPVLINKIEFLAVSNEFSFELICETRKYIFYFLYLSDIISTRYITTNELYSSYYDIITNILNKLLQIAEILKNIFFFSNDSFIQIYYFLFIGYLTKKANFDDKFFLPKAQELVTRNLNLLIRPYMFYIKNILLSKVKKDALNILVDNKVITFLEGVVESNKDEDVIVLEFFEIIEIIVEDHKAALLTSNIMKDLVQIIEKMLRFYSPANGLKLLKCLSEIKEPFIDIILFDSECINLTCKLILNFKYRNNFSFELYGTSKYLFDTITVGNGVSFLTHMACSEVIKNSSKFLRFFNVQNLNLLVDLFNSLFILWENFDENSEEPAIFEKYKDLPGFNLEIAIYDLLKVCYENVINLSSHSNKEEYLAQAELIISFLEKQLKELENRYFRVVEISDENSDENNFEEFFIYTQSKEESEKQLWTNFKFSGENIDWVVIAKTIEKHYNTELNFYYFNENTKIYTRIKDDGDFIEILEQSVLDARVKKQPVYLKLFVDDKSKKIKYIFTCINCFRRYEQEVDETGSNKLGSTETSPLCDNCKNMFLNQIVCNISSSSPQRVNSFPVYYK
jgi:hypothetical protein